MPQTGADTEALRSLQATFTRESGNVAELASTITSELGNTWWIGPAADTFKSNWESDFRPMLVRLQAALDSCSTEVSQRAAGFENVGS